MQKTLIKKVKYWQKSILDRCFVFIINWGPAKQTDVTARRYWGKQCINDNQSKSSIFLVVALLCILCLQLFLYSKGSISPESFSGYLNTYSKLTKFIFHSCSKLEVFKCIIEIVSFYLLFIKKFCFSLIVQTSFYTSKIKSM